MFIFKSLLAALVFSLSFLGTGVWHTSQSMDVPRSVVHKVEVYTSPDSPTPLGHGSGVSIAPGLILTASHVVGGENITIKVNGQLAKVVSIDRKVDLAILAVDVSCPCIPLALSSPLPDSVVVAVGYPLEFPQVVTQGQWQALLTEGVALSTTSIAFGNSGGGLFHFSWLHMRWELVGVPIGIAGVPLGMFGIPVFNYTMSVPVERVLYFLHHKSVPSQKVK